MMSKFADLLEFVEIVDQKETLTDHRLFWPASVVKRYQNVEVTLSLG
jgi:hypothetical protein